jgi:hypothetical protein
MVVATFRAHDTAIAARETPETRKAVSLVEALVGFPAAGNAMNVARESNADSPAEERVQRNALVADRQRVADRIAHLDAHLSKIADDGGCGHWR